MRIHEASILFGRVRLLTWSYSSPNDDDDDTTGSEHYEENDDESITEPGTIEAHHEEDAVQMHVDPRVHRDEPQDQLPRLYSDPILPAYANPYGYYGLYGPHSNTHVLQMRGDYQVEIPMMEGTSEVARQDYSQYFNSYETPVPTTQEKRKRDMEDKLEAEKRVRTEEDAYSSLPRVYWTGCFSEQ